MIDKMQNKVLWPALGTVALGFAITGCGNNATEAPTTPTTTGATTTQAAKDDHAHAPGEAPHAHEGDSTSAAPAELTPLFPGATLAKKAFPMDADAAAHMSEGTGVKFTGDEKEWEVYEASQNGARVGYAIMTHFKATSGDTHAVFAVDKNFKITKADAMDAPKMKPLMAQAVGKTHGAKWKVGQDFKAVSGVSQPDAQAAVDSLHKGVLILEENFNPRHSDAAPGSSESAPGHKDDGHAH